MVLALHEHLYPLLLLIPGLAAACLAVHAWRRRPVPAAGPLAAVMLTVAIWSLGFAIELLHHDATVQVWWTQVEYFGIATLPVAWLVFALHYSGLGGWVTRRRLAALLVVPIFTIVMVWTNAAHHLYYVAIHAHTGGVLTTWSADRGPAYWLHVAYSYLLVLAGITLILRTLTCAGRRYHAQSLIVLIAVLTPWITNAAYQLGFSPLPGLDITPYAFTLTGLALSWGLFRFRLLDLVPVARDAVFEALADGVIVVDEQGRLADLNGATERILGSPAAAILGRSATEVLKCWPELLARGRSASTPWPRVALGRPEIERTYECRLLPLDRLGAGPGSHLVLISDITERELTERALRATEVSYRELFNTVGEAIYIQDRQGRFLDVNRGAELMYGYPREALIGLTPEPLAAPGKNDLAAVNLALQRAFAGEPQQFEFWGRRSSGEVFPKDVRLYKGAYLGQEAVIALARDITGRKRAERQVREALGRFEALFEATPLVAIHGLDRHGCVQHWNRASEELYGYTAAQMMGQPLAGLLPSAQDAVALGQHIKRLWSGELTRLRQEWSVLTRSGATRLVDSVMFPVVEGGKVAEIFCMNVDITERKQMEDAQRLAAIGQLAAGVAHEFNNLLAAMLLQAEVTDADSPEQARSLKSLVIRATQRGGSTCADLLAFARPPELHREPLSAEAPIERALAVAHHQLDHDQVEIERDYRAPGVRVHGDPARLEQVILNLILNAAHAMSETPTVRRHRLTLATGTTPDGSEVLLSVTDTGAGIPPEHLPHVFEPFFTTNLRPANDMAEGTGLGLSVSHGIIAAHHGRMEVRSALGQGTTFVVRLPVLPTDALAEPAAVAPSLAGVLPLVSAARVLLAEDEPDVRAAVREALTRLGYTVTAVGTTDKALAALRQESYDAVVTDLMLPGEGGAAIVREARALPHPPPTLVITGRLDPHLREEMIAAGASACLRKPFTLATLLQALTEVLNGVPQEGTPSERMEGHV